MAESGDLLGGRYRLDERVGTGGMGDVWRATDTLLTRPVAVKVLQPALVAQPGFAERFRSEARTLAGLRHPGVVNVYDYGEDDVTYLVMAFVEGQPLNRRIEAAGRLSVGETVSIVTQAARALDAVHVTGVIHRDVKPGNLLIEPDGTVVLVDFGVARQAAAAELTKTNEVIGTALYMAPEQVSKRPLSPATDVYALGAVAYHCLVGEPPFPGESALQVALARLDSEPAPLPDDVPEPVRAVVMRALAREPEDRYPSAGALADAMAAAGSGTPLAVTAPLAAAGAAGAATVPTPAAGPGTTSSMPAAATARRHRTWALAGGALLVGVAVALAATLLPDDGDGGEQQNPNIVRTTEPAVTGGADPITTRRTPGRTRSASPSASVTETTAAPETSSPSPEQTTSEPEESESPDEAASSPAPADSPPPAAGGTKRP
ncbi:serine/threonine-protein kinase [Actinomycetes bacterium KLBMP 9797]